jgi:rhamnogalacturonyl hydrolase YesR
VAFVIFGLWLLFHIKKVQDGDDKEHYKRLRKWIKDNPDRAKELGYIHENKNDATE